MPGQQTQLEMSDMQTLVGSKEISLFAMQKEINRLTTENEQLRKELESCIKPSPES